MTERETMLANCLDAPADDTARLVYADYLREHDSPVGRFLWAGVTLARFRGQVVEDGMFFDAQRELNDAAPQVLGAQLKALFGWEWGDVYWDQDGEAGDRLTAVHVPGVPGGKPESCRTRNLPRHRERRPGAVYERGMLCGVRLCLSDWRHYAERVLRCCPLARVEVLDVPGLTFAIELTLAGWRLNGELRLRPHHTQHPFENATIGPFVMNTGMMGVTLPARTCFWQTEPFPRPKFVELIEREIGDLVDVLQGEAGDRWPVANPPSGAPQPVPADEGAAEDQGEEWGGPTDSEET